MKNENSCTLLDRLPRGQQRDRRQERRQHHQQQADAVDADVVGDAERRQPGMALDELEVGRRGVEAAPRAPGSRRRRRARRRAPASARGRRGGRRRRPRAAASDAGDRQGGQCRPRQRSSRHGVTLSPQVIPQDHHDADEERHRIGAHRSGLQPAQHRAPAATTAPTPLTVPSIDRHRRRATGRPARSLDRLHDRGVVDLVHVVLVQQQPVEPGNSRAIAVGDARGA